MPDPAPPLLSFESVDFAYRRHVVFEHLNLTIPPGATVLLGPNGAGKSTLLSMASLLVHPSQGKIQLDDLSSTSRGVRKSWAKRIGILPQSVVAMPGLTCREQVAYVGWLKGLSRSDAWSKGPDALEVVGLGPQANEAASTLSGGQRRRLGIAQTLVHRPDVLLLDEPSAGLDPLEVERLRSVLQTLRDRTSIIESTHQAGDVDQNFDHVIVLDQGLVRFSGSCNSFLLDEYHERRSLLDAYSAVIGSTL